MNKQEMQEWLEQNDSLIYEITSSLVEQRDSELDMNPMFSDDIKEQFKDQLFSDVAGEFSSDTGLPIEDFYSVMNKGIVYKFCIGVYDNANG